MKSYSRAKSKRQYRENPKRSRFCKHWKWVQPGQRVHRILNAEENLPERVGSLEFNRVLCHYSVNSANVMSIPLLLCSFCYLSINLLPGV